MSSAPNPGTPEKIADSAKPPAKQQVYIHRVCIQCNNVFRVPADKFDAKQCPNCHKG